MVSNRHVCKQFSLWYTYKNEIHYFTLTLVIFLSVILIPIAVLNSLIIKAILRKRTLQTPSNVLTCNIAVANLGIAFIGIPLVLSWKLVETYNDDEDILCSLLFSAYWIGGFFNGGSVVTLVFATIDRYLALVLHLRYPALVTNSRIISLCIGGWLASLFHVLLLLTGDNSYYIFTSSLTILFLGIFVFCYAKICNIVHRHHLQTPAPSGGLQPNMASLPNMVRFRKSVFNLLYVIGCQFGLLTPYMASLVIFIFYGVTDWGIKIWSIATSLIFLNSFLNPVIICLRYRELRTELVKNIKTVSPRVGHESTNRRTCLGTQHCLRS